ncbi:RNA-binding cell elongation regulator Jag/EloR [Paenibacillus spongiae]|uniref:RNA-binding protein KhpB n=1 Tax=Paenibacillus spongiae TaxID=2909671 RepID=A0ABY5SA03_9BACL|nr:RNA-binding cell elongation regulator Jag/EloR [Paenibacillus spongiae]UVI30323.1 protein jag [Paenibacillus spongiae]
MKKIVASGKTIEDAVRNGLKELQVAEDRVEIKVVEQPSKGLFGLIGVKEAKVELTLIPEPEPAAADPVAEVEHFVIEVARTMGLELNITRSETKEGLLFALSGSGDLGMLIGRRGQTLDALQYLVNIVANRYSDSHLRIILDAEDFRERRRKTLEDLSDRLAGRVIRTKKEVVLEPMSPQERKIIHSQLQDHAKVKTYSKGDEPNRRVVISLKQ